MSDPSILPFILLFLVWVALAVGLAHGVCFLVWWVNRRTSREYWRGEDD